MQTVNVDAKLAVPCGKRECPNCKETKENDSFMWRRSRDGARLVRDGKTCRACRTEITRAWRQSNPERYKKHIRKNGLSLYGVTIEQYDSMFKSQGGKCCICGEHESARKNMSVDHCHTTGVVRGLLCNQCNMALGLFKDSVTVLESAIKYLRSYSEKV